MDTTLRWLLVIILALVVLLLGNALGEALRWTWRYWYDSLGWRISVGLMAAINESWYHRLLAQQASGYRLGGRAAPTTPAEATDCDVLVSWAAGVRADTARIDAILGGIMEQPTDAHPVDGAAAPADDTAAVPGGAGHPARQEPAPNRATPGPAPRAGDVAEADPRVQRPTPNRHVRGH